MGLDLSYIDGQTPLDDDERKGLLIRSITTRGELDEFEQYNIERAIEWTMSERFRPERILTEKFVRDLHKKMFGEVWSWAGAFRQTNKNLGVDWHQMIVQLKQLNDDALYWLENNTYTPDEFAIRYKHRIVSIHCFPNGNGRHSRLMADVIISHIFNQGVFSWGMSNLNKKSEARKTYLNALRKADNGDISELILFARM